MERQLDFTVNNDRFNGLPAFVDKMRDEYKMKYVIILVNYYTFICVVSSVFLKKRLGTLYEPVGTHFL